MTGRVRDPRTVEVDDETLTELQRLGVSQVLVLDSLGAMTAGALVHDGVSFVIELEARIESGAKRTVKIKPRIALKAQGAQL